MSKHTPGPWYICYQFEDEGQYNIQLEQDTGWRDIEYMRVGGCCSLANARLIAAAPELLEALQLATAMLKGMAQLSSFSDGGAKIGAQGDELINHFNEVIAKATGETE